MDKFASLKDQLSKLKANSQYRSLKTVRSIEGCEVEIADSTGSKVLFCSNDYLNLAGEEEVKKAVSAAVEVLGVGSSASRLISGTRSEHTRVETAFAEFFAKEAALYFGSGWVANEALLRTIPQKGDLILIDKLDHASIIDAAMASEADFRTFRRGEMGKLEKYLADSRYNTKFIVTESVFSMDGDRADLAGLVKLKKRYGAVLIVDEAHSMGCFGERGAGLAEEVGVLDEIDIVVAPLGKAFGCQGAIIASDKVVIDYLVNRARAFIYTTAPAAAICAGVEKALQIVKTEPKRRKRLAENVEYLRSELKKASFNIGNSTTHIIPVIIGDSQKTLDITSRLYDRGYFVPAIRPPTVAKGSARLRISVQCEHTKTQLDGLVKALKEIGD